MGVFSFPLSIWKRFCPFPSPLREDISPLTADHSRALTQDRCFPGRWWGQLSLRAVLQGVQKQLPRRYRHQAPPEDTHTDLFLSHIDIQTLQAQLPLPATLQPWSLPYFLHHYSNFPRVSFLIMDYILSGHHYTHEDAFLKLTWWAASPAPCLNSARPQSCQKPTAVRLEFRKR